MDVTYLEDWSKWWSGQSTADLRMLGLEMLWWGRIGKVISLLSAMTILAEIIGPERLRVFSAALRSRIKLRQVAALAGQSFAWLLSMWTSILGSSAKEWSERREELEEIEEHYSEKAETYPMHWINLAISSVYALFIFFQAFTQAGLVAALILTPIMFALASLLLSPLVIVATITGGALLVALTDILFIVPTAWLLERQSWEKILKVSSAGLLLFGFHLDLLAS